MTNSLPKAPSPVLEPHRNNVGPLRLLLALMVICGHAPEQTDGNLTREPLHALTHTLTLGQVAVDGFFLVSGFLITRSVMRSPSLLPYFIRRILRIYPGYVVSFLLCIVVMPLLVGGHADGLLKVIEEILTLQSPQTEGALKGLPHPVLNGAMWTIAYEFHCYILIAMMAATGFLKRPGWVVALVLTLLVLFGFEMTSGGEKVVAALNNRIGHPGLALDVFASTRLFLAFMVGALGYLYEDLIAATVNRWTVLGAGIAALALQWSPMWAEIGLLLLGGYALFWLCFRADLGPLGKVNQDWDISYGVYLYGWPIASLILWYNRSIAPANLAVLTIPLALIAGLFSWLWVEKIAQAAGRRWR